MLAPPEIVQDVWQQLNKLYIVQTRPFEKLVPEYAASLLERRELEVRVAQLDKEASELRDENADLHRKLQEVDHLRSSNLTDQLEKLKDELSKVRSEMTDAYRDKSKALEDLMASTKQVKELEGKEQGLQQQVAELKQGMQQVQQQVSSLQEALKKEQESRALAAAEAEVRKKDKEAAEVMKAKLEQENNVLVQQLMTLKHQQAESLNRTTSEIEEMRAYAHRLQAEAKAEMEAATLAKQRILAAGGHASLAAVMDWGLAGAAAKAFPSNPVKTHAVHKQGCTSLAFDRAGNTVATCGVDRSVKTWSVLLFDQSATYLGPQAAVSDVAFTCNGQLLLGASSDKSTRVWEVQTGKQKHALTGHSAGVLCVACSPVNPALAVTCGEDRCVKLWDLGKGVCHRSFPCAKMPNSVALSHGGDMLITGHLDGTISWWDMRQCEAGTASKPFAERKEHSSLVTCVSVTHCDTEILTCSKDSVIRFWDIRTMSPVQTYRSAAFTAGTIGSMGRGRNHVEVSSDGQYLVAGSMDGGVVVWHLPEYAKGSKEAVKVLKHHKEAVVACGWSSDSSVLLSGDKGGNIAFWQLGGT